MNRVVEDASGKERVAYSLSDQIRPWASRLHLRQGHTILGQRSVS